MCPPIGGGLGAGRWYGLCRRAARLMLRALIIMINWPEPTASLLKCGLEMRLSTVP